MNNCKVSVEKIIGAVENYDIGRSIAAVASIKNKPVRPGKQSVAMARENRGLAMARQLQTLVKATCKKSIDLDVRSCEFVNEFYAPGQSETSQDSASEDYLKLKLELQSAREEITAARSQQSQSINRDRYETLVVAVEDLLVQLDPDTLYGPAIREAVEKLKHLVGR